MLLKLWYGLKDKKDWSEIEKKAARALMRFISKHPHNIAEKTKVMVEVMQVKCRFCGEGMGACGAGFVGEAAEGF